MSEYVETDRDRWAEVEARSCDKAAEALEESGREWLAARLHPENAMMALRCAVKAETWREMAQRLRQPAAIGREMAARSDAACPPPPP